MTLRASTAAAVLVLLGATGCGGGDDDTERKNQSTEDLIFVADEDSGTISVIEEHANRVLTAIALPDMYMPHNVQASPDGKSVWVAAPPMMAGHPDQAIVIDPQTLKITSTIDLGDDLHVAHVVLDPASKHAYVTANEGNRVIEIDAETRAVTRTIDLGAGSGPHGARFCRDRLYVAGMSSKSLIVVDLAKGTSTEVDLGGVAVQTACTPDGKFVLASLYDTKEVVRYEIDTQKLARVALPAGSQGPVQLYPSPDSGTVWVCDQGMLEGRPASNKLYAVDVGQAKVSGTVEVGSGAHGVVVSDDGALAYVTNVADDSVSVVDTAALSVVATISVGTKPNGISHWHRTGGMP
ncbi:MAG: YncE family protein [Myxococcales bacterium]|nr:YncE family protein [Myxococcales bacterium]